MPPIALCPYPSGQQLLDYVNIFQMKLYSLADFIGTVSVLSFLSTKYGQ